MHGRPRRDRDPKTSLRERLIITGGLAVAVVTGVFVGLGLSDFWYQ